MIQIVNKTITIHTDDVDELKRKIIAQDLQGQLNLTFNNDSGKWDITQPINAIVAESVMPFIKVKPDLEFMCDEQPSDICEHLKVKNMKQIISDTISDLGGDFLFYGRKEDEQLLIEKLNEAVKSGEITIDGIVSEFRKGIEESFF